MTTVQERRLAEFVDRTDEMERFVQLLGDGDPNIMCVSGNGGVGKSSLMAKMLHECAAREIRKSEVTWTETRNYDYLGIMHADLAFRPSLAADLMEPMRPHVERQVLEFLKRRTFRECEFFETREGQCRLVPPLTTEVTESLYAEIPDVRRIVKRVRGRLWNEVASPVS